MDATLLDSDKGLLDIPSDPRNDGHCCYIDVDETTQSLHMCRADFLNPGRAVQSGLSQTLSRDTQEYNDPGRCGPEFCRPGISDESQLNEVLPQASDSHMHSDQDMYEQETCRPEQCGLTSPRDTEYESDTDSSSSCRDGSLNQVLPIFSDAQTHSNPERCDIGAFSHGGLSLARTLPRHFKYHAFFCHSWKDKDWVLRLIHTLEAPPYNYKCCYDDRNFEYNQSILDNIPECMEESLKVVLVLSPNFIESNWCDFEARQTMERDIESRGGTLIPILYKECGVPKYISQVMYIDAKSDRFMERLVQTLNSTRPQSVLHRLSHKPEYHQTHNGDVMLTQVIDKDQQPPIKLPKELVNHHCPDITFAAYNHLMTSCIYVTKINEEMMRALTVIFCLLVGYFGSLDVVLGSMSIVHALFNSFSREPLIRILIGLAFIYNFQDVNMVFYVALLIIVYNFVTKVGIFNKKVFRDHRIVILGFLCVIVFLFSLTGIKIAIATFCLLHYVFGGIYQNFVFRCMIIFSSLHLFGLNSVVTAGFLLALWVVFQIFIDFINTSIHIRTLYRSNIMVLSRRDRLWTTSTKVHFVYYNLHRCLAYLDELQINTFKYQTGDTVPAEHHIKMPTDPLQWPVTSWQLYCYMILVTKNCLPPGGVGSHAMQVTCLCHYLEQSRRYNLHLIFYMIKDALF